MKKQSEAQTSVASHTPTPWRETEGSRDSEFNYIVGFKTQVICEIDISHPEQKANAAFIVRAVNSHEELLATLKELRQVVVNFNQGQKSVIDHIGGFAIHEADKAIAKAEGK